MKSTYSRSRFWQFRLTKLSVSVNRYPPKFEEHLVHTSAGIRITGHKQEIDLVLNALARAGFFYQSNKTLYPCRDNPRRFNLYLNFMKCPALLEAKGVKDD